MKKRGLYIHIPFCAKKCYYCDFYSIVNSELIEAYIDALATDIEKINNKNFTSIYIGGGSPSLLTKEQIDKLFKKLDNFNILMRQEITIEVNPSQITKEKLQNYLNLGINRISIGIQSFNDNLLKNIGRLHTSKQAVDGVSLAKSVGFENISLDLIYGLPNETILDLENDLQKATDLHPTHISVYELMIEENTVFYNMLNENKLQLINDKDSDKMYDIVNETLPKLNYNRYEVSNFAQNGYECKHNLLYWSDEEYIGVGASAASYTNNIRYKNNCSVKEYIDKINNNETINDMEERTKEDAIFEYIFLSLRKVKGLSKEDFYKKFGVHIENFFDKQIKKLKNLELICEDDNNIKLTNRGFKVSNMVFEEFILK